MSLTTYSFVHKVIFTLLILGTALLPMAHVSAATVGEPVFEYPHYGTHQLPSAPTIQGFTDTRTRIEVHIDGEKAGDASVTESGSDRVSFSFVPLEPLSPGYHSLEAFASAVVGVEERRQSLWWFFHVADPLPAPIIRAAVERQNGIVVVSGVVKSGLRVRIMVDGVEQVTSGLWIHASGASGFTIEIPSLARGTHTITAYAVREDGKVSAASDPLTTTITGIAAIPSPRVSTPTIQKQEKQKPKEESMIRIKPELPVSREVPPLLEQVTKPPEVIQQEGREAGAVTIVPPVVISATSVTPEEEAVQVPAVVDTSRSGLSLFVALVMVLIMVLVWYLTSRHEEMQYRKPIQNPYIAPSSPSSLPYKTASPVSESPPRASHPPEDTPPPPPPPPPSGSSLPFDYM
ncbi:MAG: hypothetical protein AB1352_03920 [Patescibacteria group bacterium]